MGLISGGIDKVRAFALPAGIGADGRVVAEPQTVLVRWHSEWSNKLHQIYVGGEYAGTTADTEQREMVVHVRCLWQSAVRIEVFAVEPWQGSVDLSGELVTVCNGSGRVRISWPRLQNLPVGAVAQIFSNKGSGSIDYDEPVTSRPERLWPAWQDKGGFGLSRFGRSDFGFDGSAAVGFGRGAYGRGEFGFDADMVSWTSSELRSGIYKFAVRIVDGFGNEDEGLKETEPTTVIPGAKPPEEVTIASFDKGTNALILSVS